MASSSGAPFDYEILDKDPGIPKTAGLPSNCTNPWIEPEPLKLLHRIGRGPFGDVWLATLHQST
ncbi:E3 ubiquitin-protein ligase KEG-like, partial [Trifolium medium]|nr:E3 ubiquitin-protein ligase KEG-like [Trifolium medium]